TRIITGITALGATALSTATLPYFSQMTADRDWTGCRHTLKRYSVLIIGITVPFTLAFIACSRPLIRVLYQRGAFTAADTEMVAHVQSFFAIQIPFLMLCALLVRFVSAIKRHDLLLYGSAINLAVNIVLNLAFVKKWGVAGIALASSMVYVVSFAFLSIAIMWILAQKSSPVPEPVQVHQVSK
ncbi:MAG TPA: lipid II flippase MurJ, partial [Candidatus Angelobacter sp.]|nr:lipid II flippase MurJ [Candidatus Angelobacter sp.]